MKLNITFNDDKDIGNYTNIHLSSKTYKQELQEVPKESCEHILITDAINRVEESEAIEVIDLSLRCLKNGGNVTISMVDFNTLCTAHSSGNIDHEIMNGIVSTSQCVIEYPVILQAFSKHSVKLVSSKSTSLLYTIDGNKDAS